MSETTAPVIEPEIQHLAFTPNCECACHKDEPVPAANVLIIHNQCRIKLLCERCTLTKEKAFRFMMGRGLGVWCPFCTEDCASFDELYQVVPL